MKTFGTLIAISLLVLLDTKPSLELSCVSEDGSPVDWFIVYKMPKLETSSYKPVKSGFGYIYITDKLTNDWTLSTKNISQKESIFGRTISPVLESVKSRRRSNPPKEVSYLAYNDQSPGMSSLKVSALRQFVSLDGKSSSGAHAKGLFAMGSNGGFWLIHSVPKFPDLDKGYSFPDSGRNNGQTAICVSLSANDIKSVDNIANQLLIMRPKIYGKRLLDSLTKKSNLWKDLDNEEWIKDDSSSELEITSKKGTVFTSFSKSNKYPNDIYSGLIANYFKENLLVQSWRNGAGEKLESDCTDKYKVQNIDRIGIKNFKSDWNASEDHSKWGISNTNGFTCIADINRMRSQFRRGGGSLCIHSEKVWNIFKKSIEVIEGCPLNSSKHSSTESSEESNKSKSRTRKSG